MKKHFAMFVAVLVMLELCAPPVFSQASATVQGVCKDAQGNPIADAVVVYANVDNGQKYTLKTNKKGEYFSLGLASGKYLVTLYRNADDAKANKEVFHVNGFQVQTGDNNLDFDMKKEQEKAAQGQGLTPEQLKQRQELEEKQKKEGNTIKALNEKIVAANTAAKAGDFDTAINTLNEAVQIDATRDIIWAQLADAYRGSGLKQTDPAEKAKRLQEAMADYQKAIDIKQKAMESGTKKTRGYQATGSLLQQPGRGCRQGRQGRRCLEGLYPGGAGQSRWRGKLLLQRRRGVDQCRQGGRRHRRLRQMHCGRSQQSRRLLPEGRQHDWQGHPARRQNGRASGHG